MRHPLTSRRLGRLVTVLAVGASLCAGCGRKERTTEGLTRPQTYDLAVSPDGTQVAFDLSVPKGRTTPPEGIYVVSLATGEARCLVHGSREPSLSVTMPGWLPGNRGIVYVSRGGGVCSVQRTSLEGGPAEKLVESRSEAFFDPLPSPDGRWVAYWAQRLGQGAKQVAVVAADGSRGSVVADPGTEPSWDGSSELLYFIADGRAAGSSSVRSAALVAGRFAVRATALYESPDLAGCAVSPDGKQLLLTLLRDECTPLVVAPTAQATEQTLVEDHPHVVAGAPQWAPDGKGFCYLRLGVNTLELVEVDWPSGEKRVLANKVHELPRTGAWTPQGLIVFRRHASEIWTVRSDGTDERLLFSADSSISP